MIGAHKPALNKLNIMLSAGNADPLLEETKSLSQHLSELKRQHRFEILMVSMWRAFESILRMICLYSLIKVFKKTKRVSSYEKNHSTLNNDLLTNEIKEDGTSEALSDLPYKKSEKEILQDLVTNYKLI